MIKFSKFNDIDAVMTRANKMLSDIEQGYLKCLQEEKIPESLLVDIKDYLANLRTSLDYLWCKISNASNGYFPIANSEKEFNNKTVGVDKKYVDILKRWQSYNKNSWIRCFNLFRNKNVHFTLVPQTKEELREFSIKEAGSKEKMVTFSGCTFRGTGNHISVGGVPVPIDLKTQFPGNVEGLDIERKIWVNFLFDGSSISLDFPTGVSVLPFLKESFKNVSQIVTELEEVFCMGKFKETEIGSIPEEWDIVTIGSMFNVETGKNVKTEEKIDFGRYEILGANGRIGYTNNFLFDGEYILTGRVGTLGKLYYRKDKFWPSDNVLCISKKENSTNLKFLFYYLKILDFHSLNRGSTQPLITQTDIKNYLMPLPEDNEQFQMVEILSSFDDKIELNRKINSNLEKIASLLFKHYFIDIGDTLPHGWSVGRIGDFAKVKSGFAFKGGDFKNDGVPVIKIKNVIDPEISFKNIDYISERIVEEKAQDFILKPKDILIAMSGNTTGKIGIMPKTKNYYVLNQRVGKYFLKNENNLGYLYFYLRSGDVQKNIIQSAYGSAQPNISPSILEDMKILIPSKEALDNFNSLSNKIIDIISSNNFENNTLLELRDSLLPRLMNGKIRVKI